MHTDIITDALTFCFTSKLLMSYICWGAMTHKLMKYPGLQPWADKKVSYKERRRKDMQKCSSCHNSAPRCSYLGRSHFVLHPDSLVRLPFHSSSPSPSPVHPPPLGSSLACFLHLHFSTAGNVQSWGFFAQSRGGWWCLPASRKPQHALWLPRMNTLIWLWCLPE